MLEPQECLQPTTDLTLYLLIGPPHNCVCSFSVLHFISASISVCLRRKGADFSVLRFASKRENVFYYLFSHIIWYGSQTMERVRDSSSRLGNVIFVCVWGICLWGCVPASVCTCVLGGQSSTSVTGAVHMYSLIFECRPGWSGFYRDPPMSASWMAGLKVWAITWGHICVLR